MKLNTLIPKILIFCLPIITFGQQAKLEGNVFDDKEKHVPSVRIISPGGQPATTDSKGHFKIYFPSSIQPGQAVQIQVAKPNWVVYEPMFGKTAAQSAERNYEMLLVIIVPKGSPLNSTPKRISELVAKLSAENIKQRTEVSSLKKKLDRLAFLQKYADEYGMPRDKVIAAIQQWAYIKETDDNEERALKEYWLENYDKSASLALESAQGAEDEWEKANRQKNEASSKIIRRYKLAGNAFFANYKFREALDAYNKIDQHFEKAKLPKEDWRMEWTELRRLVGNTKLALGERVEGEESERLFKEAIVDYQQIDFIFSKEQFPEQWATSQNNLSAAFSNLGIRIGGTESIEYLNKAVDACRAALQVFTQERTPQDWASAQHNLGSALLYLGERGGGDESAKNLKEAVRVLQGALEVRTREQFPQDWALTQNNLSGALRQLGARVGGTESIKYLNEAVDACRAALQVFTRERFSQDWAEVQNNLGAALYHLGIRANEINSLEYLGKAGAASRAALQVFTRKQSPQHWARAQNNLGASLWFLALRESGDASINHLKEAVAAFRNALEVRTREQFPQDWALTQNNLGGALSNLAERVRGDESIKNLNEAIAVFRDALEVRTREQFPQDWALTQNNLGTALLFLGERSSERDESIKNLNKAIAVFRDALEVRTREQFPQDWALTQSNLGTALLSLGKQSKTKDESIKNLNEAIAVFRDALEVRTREQFPKHWATIQSNLGGALWNLGKQVGSIKYLNEAVAIFRVQPEITTREQSPQSWAIAQRNLGGVLLDLVGLSGNERVSKEDSIKYLNEAVVACRAALQVFTQEQTPQDWANLHAALGTALLNLGRQVVNETDSNKYLNEAVTAFRATLLILNREQSPKDWAITQYNLGGALLSLGLKASEKNNRSRYLNEAVVAYRAALQVFTQEQSPLDWARSQNNLGVALRTLGEQLEREENVMYSNDALKAFRAALLVFTREQFPQEWSNTTKHVGKTYILLKDWQNAGETFATVLTLYPGENEAYIKLSALYQNNLFQFNKAFLLTQQWLAQHKNDFSAQADLAERYFTTEKFSECEQLINALLLKQEVPISTKTALRVIEIAALIVSAKLDQVTPKFDALIEEVSGQPTDFRIAWVFDGTKHFIDNNSKFLPYRGQLTMLLDALVGKDRTAMIKALTVLKTTLKK